MTFPGIVFRTPRVEDDQAAIARLPHSNGRAIRGRQTLPRCELRFDNMKPARSQGKDPFDDLFDLFGRVFW